MAFDIEKLETILGPRGTNAAFAVFGGLLSHLWSQFRARRIILSWTANFQNLSPQGSDPIFSQIQVLLNSQPYQNLHSCQITILNESPRDVDEFDILFTFQNTYLIQHGQGNISTSAKTLLFSQSFFNTVQIVQKLPETERSAHQSYSYLMQNREFHLPSLNRGGSATFTFLIHSTEQNKVASVIVTTEKKGVKLLSRPAQPSIFAVPLSHASALGILVSIVLVVVIAYSNLNCAAAAFLGFLVGATALIIGILLIRFFRLLRTLFG